MGSRLTWPHGPPVSKAFFGPFLCVKAFFGPFLCGGTSQKKLGSVGAGVRRMGSHLTWPHGPPVSKAFFGPFLCAKAFFGPFLCGGMFQKNLGSVGAGVPFSGQVFFRPFWNSALSDVWVPVWLGLMGLQCRRLFLDFFCVWRLFLDPFCVVGRSKKTLAVGGQVFRFLVRLFFRPFWNSPLSDVWVSIWLGLMGLQCRRLFLDPFCARRFFLDPFCVVGRSKKNLGSGGAGVPFSGQASF